LEPAKIHEGYEKKENCTMKNKNAAKYLKKCGSPQQLLTCISFLNSGERYALPMPCKKM
jgi:hypothetical protein